MKKLLIWDFDDTFTPPEYFNRSEPCEECFKCPFLYDYEFKLDIDEYELNYDIGEEIPYEATVDHDYFCRCNITNGTEFAKETELCPLYDLFYD